MLRGGALAPHRRRDAQKPALYLEVAEALEDGADDERKSDGSILEDFGEAAAFFRRNEFAPTDGFGVGASAEATPMNGLGTDADAVVVTLKREIFVAAAGHEFGVNAELLGPVARNAAADGEDTHFFGGHHGVGEGLEILEGIEAKDGALVALAGVLIESEVEAELGIGEGGDKDRDVVSESGFEDAAAFGVVGEILADAFVELPTADGFGGIPIVEDDFDNFFDVIQIGFGLEGVVDTVIAGEEELLVVHFGGVVAEVRAAGGFDEAMSHESSGGDDGFDDAGFDEIAENESHFGDGEGPGERHDDETVFVAGHGFEDVGSVTDLASGVGGVAHGANEIVNGFDGGEIEGVDGTELVFHGIVENTTGDGLLGTLGHYDSSGSRDERAGITWPKEKSECMRENCNAKRILSTNETSERG